MSIGSISSGWSYNLYLSGVSADQRKQATTAAAQQLAAAVVRPGQPVAPPPPPSNGGSSSGVSGLADGTWAADLSQRISWSAALAAATSSTSKATAAASGGAVNTLLGMNSDELDLQLRQGVSLNQIALSKGIAQSDLVTAITADFTGNNSAAGSGSGSAVGTAGGAVNALLGMNPDELAVQLQQGASLNDIARSKGISSADLLGAIRADQAPPPPSGSSTTQPTSVTGLFGMNADELNLQLQQGFSLNDIAQTKGINRDDLLSAIQTDLSATGSPGAGSADAAAQVADTVGLAWPLGSSGTGSTGSDAVSGTGGTSGAGSGSDWSTGAVSSLLHMRPEEIDLQLQQGVSLNNIAETMGVSRGNLLTALKSDLSTYSPSTTDQDATAVQLADTVGLAWPTAAQLSAQ